MSVFVDTGVYYALQNESEPRHDAARTGLNAVLSGVYGRPYTSDYVLDEAVTLTLQRTARHGEAVTVADRIRGVGSFPAVYDLLVVDDDTVRRTAEHFDRYSDHSLSFTDASTLVLVEAHDVDYVLSFDDDFDGLVDRLDPRTIEEPS